MGFAKDALAALTRVLTLQKTVAELTEEVARLKQRDQERERRMLVLETIVNEARARHGLPPLSALLPKGD